MNKPIIRPVADDDIGPLDEHGQQIWSPEEEAAITRIESDPDFWPSLQRSREAVARGEWLTTEQMASELERRRAARRHAA